MVVESSAPLDATTLRLYEGTEWSAGSRKHARPSRNPVAVGAGVWLLSNANRQQECFAHSPGCNTGPIHGAADLTTRACSRDVVSAPWLGHLLDAPPGDRCRAPGSGGAGQQRLPRRPSSLWSLSLQSVDNTSSRRGGPALWLRGVSPLFACQASWTGLRRQEQQRACLTGQTRAHCLQGHNGGSWQALRCRPVACAAAATRAQGLAALLRAWK